ncbi:MAG TPA: hypothetical protein VGR89_13930, partial [Puia sp.]|nr:hypothetical protein [Puia sp.]
GGIFFQDARHCPIQNNTLFDNVTQLGMRHALATGTFLGNDVSNNVCVSRVDTQYCVQATSIGPSSRLTSFEYAHNNHFAQIASGSYFWNLAFTDTHGTGTFGSWQSAWREDVVYSNLLPLTFGPYTVNYYIGGNLYTKGIISTPFSSAAAGVRVITSAGIGAIDSGYYYVLNYTMAAPDASHFLLNFIEEGISPYPTVTPYVTVPTAAPTSNVQVVWQATRTYPSCLLTFQSNSNMPTMVLSNISLYRASVTPNNPANDYIFQYNASKSSTALPLSGTWQDAAGNTYSGSMIIPAYGSVVLLKKS